MRRLVLALLLLTMACNSETINTPESMNPDQSSRCQPVPSSLTNTLLAGLTADGTTQISNVYAVKNNDGGPWTFIAGRVSAPGIDETLVWATASLDLDNDPLLVATDSVSEEFSVWSLPGGNRFASQFNDDMRAVRECVERG